MINPTKTAVTERPASSKPTKTTDADWIPFIDTPEGMQTHESEDPPNDQNAGHFLQRLQPWLLWGSISTCLAGLQFHFSEDKEPRLKNRTDNSKSKIQKTLPLSAQQQAQSLIETLNTSVRSYLEAYSIEEKIQWVRHPERVRPMMINHYSKQPIKGRKFDRILSQRAVSIWSRPFIILVASVDDGKKHFLTVEQIPDGSFKIDWETDVHYLPLSWKDYVRSSSAPSSVDMRVYVKPDHHYTAPFHDSRIFECFRLVSRDDKQVIFGYAKRGTPVWHDLRKFFTGRRKKHFDGEPLILRLKQPDNKNAQSGVIIEKFLSDRWIVPPLKETQPTHTALSLMPPDGK